MGIFRPNVKKMKAKKDVKGLIKALNNSNRDTRSQAVIALGELGDTLAVDPLIRKMTVWDSEIQINAARALGEIGDARAAEPLIRRLGDTDELLQSHAVEALVKIGEPVVEPVIKALQDDGSQVREKAADVLDRLGCRPKNNTEIASYLVAKKQWDKVRVLGKAGVKPLSKVLMDRNVGIRRPLP